MANRQIPRNKNPRRLILLLFPVLLLASCIEEDQETYIYEKAPQALIFFVDAEMADSIASSVKGYNSNKYGAHINLFDGNFYPAFYDPHTSWGLGSGYDENAKLERAEYMGVVPGYRLTLDTEYEDNYMVCYFDRDTAEYMLKIHYTVYFSYSDTDSEGEPTGDEMYEIESPHIDNISDFERTYVSYDIYNEQYAFTVYVFI